MTSTVLKQSEKQFQAAVVEYAKLNGWKTYHTFDSRRSDPGFPDLVLSRGDRLVFLELKSETGRASTAQLEWLDALHRAPGITVGVVRPRDWSTIEEMLSR